MPITFASHMRKKLEISDQSGEDERPEEADVENQEFARRDYACRPGAARRQPHREVIRP